MVRGESADDVNQASDRIRLAIIEGGKDVIEDTGAV